MAKRELPLPYVPISPSIKRSERFFAFCEALDIHNDTHALTHIVSLLLWAGEFHPNGKLGTISPAYLKSVCGWGGEAGELLAAMLGSGWLIETPEGLEIEGWCRHGGLVLEKREQWRARKKAQRTKAAGNVH